MGLAFLLAGFLRFPRRGGNYNNGGNAGLGYVNCNNPRGNANRNYGVRPRSQHIYMFRMITHRRTNLLVWEGYVSFGLWP